MHTDALPAVLLACCAIAASRLGCAPLNASMKPPDLVMVSAMASIGLTVALFIAGEAYKQERLQSEAKMGALLSGLMGGLCIGLSKTPLWRSGRAAARRAKAIERAAKIRASMAQFDSGIPGDVPRPHELLDIGDEDEEEEVDEDDVAYIISHALERSYAVSRAAMLMQVRVPASAALLRQPSHPARLTRQPSHARAFGGILSHTGSRAMACARRSARASLPVVSRLSVARPSRRSSRVAEASRRQVRASWPASARRPPSACA